MEQQIWDRRWENGYCFPFRNAETGRYYAKDIYDGVFKSLTAKV